MAQRRMHSNLTSYTITDYCQAMGRDEIIVNRDYQRSEKIWPLSARSYLIESILLGYPIPKLSLYQVTDLKSRKTVKEIVDGQQRSMAIRDFYDNKFRLSSTLDSEELRGLTYSELPEDYQQHFIDYQLGVDLFLAATPEDVREVFRRMNSYTMPLNGEEQRHATWQGLMKWFIHRLARRFDQGFTRIGTFGAKQLVRMGDTKLLAEITHAILFGITTTDRKKLDALYRDRDAVFSEESDLERLISEALDQVISWEPLHNGSLMKPYVLYSLVLALIHVRSPVVTLQSLYASPELSEFDDERVLANLSNLGAALSDPENAGLYEEFVAASSERTNVKGQRETRFVWMCKALADDMA